MNYKPKLFRLSGFWFCQRGNNIGMAETPSEAYSKWVDALLTPPEEKQYIGEVCGVSFWSASGPFDIEREIEREA